MTQKKKNNRNKEILILGAGVIIILILLILVIRSVQNRREEEMESSRQESIAESVSQSIAESIEASLAAEAEKETEPVLTESTNPEIRALAENYFACRLNGDLPGLLALFGKEELQDAEDMEKRLTAQKSWVRSYDDIRVFVLPGAGDGEVIGVVKYLVNFRRVNTKAPGIMYFYAVSDGSGSWHIEENLPKEKRDFITESFEKSGVNNLISENTEALSDALSADSDLALMYESFMNGEIYADYNLDYEREQEVNLFENPEDSILITE